MAVDTFECHTAIAHRVEQTRGRAVVELAPDHDRTSRIENQPADGCERESPIRALIDYFLDRQATQHARQGGRVGADCLSNFRTRSWAVGKHLRDPELGGTYASCVVR